MSEERELEQLWDWDANKTPFGELQDIATQLKIERDTLRKQLEDVTKKWQGVLDDNNILRNKLKIAMNTLRNVRPIMKLHGYSIDEPLAEIKKYSIMDKTCNK